jgi:hypothetical protein
LRRSKSRRCTPGAGPERHGIAVRAVVERLTAAPHLRNVKTSLPLHNAKNAAMMPMED